MRDFKILLSAVIGMAGAGLLLFVSDEAKAQFICNGAMQAGPNCGPPPQVQVTRVRIDKAFGALAYDDAKARWYGTYGYASSSKAKSGAVSHCQQNAGSSCRLMLSYSNQCAAVARVVQNGRELLGQDSVNTGSTQAEAEANAERACQADWDGASCKIIMANCSHHGVARWKVWVNG